MPGKAHDASALNAPSWTTPSVSLFNLCVTYAPHVEDVGAMYYYMLHLPHCQSWAFAGIKGDMLWHWSPRAALGESE